MFDRQLPKSLISADNQILLDKYEVEDLEHLKVDILANRGLSQLLEVDPDMNLTDYPMEDEATAKETIQELCEKFLTNPVIENAIIHLQGAE